MKTELKELKYLQMVKRFKQSFPFVTSAVVLSDEQKVDNLNRKRIYISCELDKGTSSDKTKIKREWNENFNKLPSNFEGFEVSAIIL